MKTALQLAALVLMLAARAVMAQDVMFYEYRDFGGGSFSANDAIPDLANTGYNDRAGSLVIRSGLWQVCTDANYQGRCVTLQPGEYRDLASMGFSGNISSARPIGYGPAGAPGAGATPVPGPGGRGGPAVILFDDFQQAGRQFAVDGPVENLDRSGFNDRARSMIVNAGRWELCRDAYFRGTCEVYGPGRYNAIGDLSGELSSLRPAGGPLAQPGGYPQNWGRRGPRGALQQSRFPGTAVRDQRGYRAQPRQHRVQRSCAVDPRRAGLLDLLQRRRFRRRPAAPSGPATTRVSPGASTTQSPRAAGSAANIRTAAHRTGAADATRCRSSTTSPDCAASSRARTRSPSSDCRRNWYRPSYFAAKYMQEHGYRVIPVNPTYADGAGRDLLSEPARDPDAGRHRRLLPQGPTRCPRSPTMRSRSAPRCSGCSSASDNDEAARIAPRMRDSTSCMNRCVKIEHARIMGGLNWAGVNTGVISARRPVVS